MIPQSASQCYEDLCSGKSQDFSRGVVCANLLLGKIFAKNCMKLDRGGVPSAQPHPWIRLCLYTRREYFAVDKLIFVSLARMV